MKGIDLDGNPICVEVGVRCNDVLNGQVCMIIEIGEE